MEMNTFTVSGTQYRLTFDTAPFACFMIHRLNNGVWEGGPSFGDYYGGAAVNEFLAEVNGMGAKAWIRAHICPWFRAAFKNAYGAGAAPAPPADAVVTTANMNAVFNGILAAAAITVGADGGVELVV